MKNKFILPISIIVGCIILGGFYYAVQKNYQKQEDLSQEKKSEYILWKEKKMSEDNLKVEKDLNERWADDDFKANDQSLYDGVSEKRYMRAWGQVLELPVYTKDIRELQINSLIDKETNEIKKLELKKLAEEHPYWIANHIYYVVNKKVDTGMTKDMIELSWGKPDNLSENMYYDLWWYWGEGDLSSNKRDLLVFNKYGVLLLIYREK